MLVLALEAASLCACAGVRHPPFASPASGARAGFTAAYRISWTERGRPRKARLEAAYLPPRRLRLEILDPLGGSRALLVVSGDRALVVDIPGKEYRRYPGGSDAVKALSGIDLDPELLAALLLGSPAAAGNLRCEPEGEGTTSVSTCQGPDGNPLIRVLRGGAAWEISSRGASPVRIGVETPPGHPEAPPSQIQVQEEKGASAVLELREFLPSPPREDLFSLEPPPSFRDASADPASTAPWREAS